MTEASAACYHALAHLARARASGVLVPDSATSLTQRDSPPLPGLVPLMRLDQNWNKRASTTGGCSINSHCSHFRGYGLGLMVITDLVLTDAAFLLRGVERKGHGGAQCIRVAQVQRVIQVRDWRVW